MIIKEIIQAIWFTTKTRAETAATAQILKDRTIPLTIILLTSTAVRFLFLLLFLAYSVLYKIEHALGEHATGSEMTNPFREPLIRSR